MPKYNFEICDNPTVEDIKSIESGLSASHPSEVEVRNYKPLAIFLRNEKGEVIAGLEGSTYWGWLNIRLLWVSEDLRDKGIGTELVKKAEDVASKRKCHSSVVDTFSFQAREFYEKLGYTSFGTLDNFPNGHNRIYLTKTGLC